MCPGGRLHIAVFAGFGSGALGDRLQMAGAKALFCSDIAYRKGKDVPLKAIVDEALAREGVTAATVVVHARGRQAPSMKTGRDISWQEFLALGEGGSGDVEWLESNEPAYILATSGTTAKPKLAVHTHGGSRRSRSVETPASRLLPKMSGSLAARRRANSGSAIYAIVARASAGVVGADRLRP